MPVAGETTIVPLVRGEETLQAPALLEGVNVGHKTPRASEVSSREALSTPSEAQHEFNAATKKFAALSGCAMLATTVIGDELEKALSHEAA